MFNTHFTPKLLKNLSMKRYLKIRVALTDLHKYCNELGTCLRPICNKGG